MGFIIALILGAIIGVIGAISSKMHENSNNGDVADTDDIHFGDYESSSDSGECNGDCDNCPDHYGYRYGRWYYGHGHQHGCERGGNGGASGRTYRD